MPVVEIWDGGERWRRLGTVVGELFGGLLIIPRRIPCLTRLIRTTVQDVQFTATPLGTSREDHQPLLVVKIHQPKPEPTKIQLVLAKPEAKARIHGVQKKRRDCDEWSDNSCPSGDFDSEEL